jgi:1-acyl-sn-glycerol-3-phosphate acyltransferase
MIWMIGSLVFWGFLALSSLVLFPIGLLVWLATFAFDRRRWVMHRFTSLWASLYTWLNPAWPVRVIGRERLFESGPAVIVANHLSLVDILVLFRLQSHFKWVSKIENFRVPLIGWNMRLCDYIPLRRGDKQSIIAMLRRSGM